MAFSTNLNQVASLLRRTCFAPLLLSSRTLWYPSMEGLTARQGTASPPIHPSKEGWPMKWCFICSSIYECCCQQTYTASNRKSGYARKAPWPNFRHLTPSEEKQMPYMRFELETIWKRSRSTNRSTVTSGDTNELELILHEQLDNSSLIRLFFVERKPPWCVVACRQGPAAWSMPVYLRLTHWDIHSQRRVMKVPTSQQTLCHCCKIRRRKLIRDINAVYCYSQAEY
jgi:hypothetical protein